MRSSTGCSSCAPTPSYRPCRSSCAIGTCWRWSSDFKTTKALLTTRPIFHKTDAAQSAVTSSAVFLAVLLRKELFDRLAARRHGDLEWQHIVDDLDELSEIEVEQDGRRALLRTAPGATIDPLCRALGIALPPVFQEIPPAPEPARSCGA